MYSTLGTPLKIKTLVHWVNSETSVKFPSSQSLDKIQLNFIIEVQFCVMCHKLFIFKESFIS